MEENSITFINYFGGGLSFFILSLIFIFLWRKKEIHISMVVASTVSTIWCLSLASNYNGYTLGLEKLMLLETLRYGSWVSALLLSLPFITGHKLDAKFRHTIHAVWITSFAVILTLSITKHSAIQNSTLLIWNNLILSIVGLVSVEQLFRNTSKQRIIKLLSIGIGALLIYDIYLFSFSLIFNQIDLALWQSRGIINGTIALLLAAGVLIAYNEKSKHTVLSISRPVVFYTTSMSVAGVFLAFIAIGGYYVQIYGGQWGRVLQITVLFIALTALVTLFVSTTMRARLNVWISKHFFRHKYDYRVEWLRLINSLTQPSTDENFHSRAIHVVASVFKSPGGCLWLLSNNQYQPVEAFQLNLPEGAIENAESPFCRAMLEQEWVFSPHVSDDIINNKLPSWIKSIPDVWLVLPLLTESKLLGFIVLTAPKHDGLLTWEDLDLLKTVGRQVASYLDRHQAAEQLSESKQFDAFNKLTAFIMHDLKNLIAQQGLVVENAAKHKDNPAFVEDAIKTIDNSVKRMSNLLRKLQQQEATEIRHLELHKVLMEATKNCQENKPTPSLRLEETSVKVDADQDLLILTLVNIIQNAQEATNDNGFVDVTLRREDKNAIIIIEDNGSGMSENFIRNRLFKPFETTKSGKGMGIGVHQSREYIAGLDGEINVESHLNEGSTFTIIIPTSAG
jgi:putative PEP-CTERM system histidine kinase